MYCSRCGTPCEEAASPCTGCGYTPDLRHGPQRNRRTSVLVASLAVVTSAGILAAAGALASTPPDIDPVTESRSSATTPEPVAEYADQELVAEFGDAVFRIDVEGCGFSGSGSGFAISERHIVTNWHVVSVDGTPSVVSRDGTTRAGEVIGATPDPDIAVIELAEPVDKVLEWADTGQLSEGQHLVGLGYPVPAMEFSVNAGSVVSFQNKGSVRQAIRTDASLDRGNSGGPALTAQGQVAGVITQMADNTDGFQDVPLLFTQSAVGPAVDRMIATPVGFEPDCGQVSSLPEFPSDYFDIPDLPSAPPPTLPPYTPPQYTLPEYSLPTTTTVPCPTGSLTVSVTSVTADDPYDLGGWDVTITGSVTNNTSATITLPMIDVTVSGGPYSTIAIPDTFTIPAGGSSGWSASTFVFDAPRPTSATASVSSFSWDDFNMIGCPTQ